MQRFSSAKTTDDTVLRAMLTKDKCGSDVRLVSPSDKMQFASTFGRHQAKLVPITMCQMDQVGRPSHLITVSRVPLRQHATPCFNYT
jgi:hypothetical protein